MHALYILLLPLKQSCAYQKRSSDANVIVIFMWESLLFWDPKLFPCLVQGDLGVIWKTISPLIYPSP
jgi:hypothetical protein